MTTTEYQPVNINIYVFSYLNYQLHYYCLYVYTVLINAIVVFDWGNSLRKTIFNFFKSFLL